MRSDEGSALHVELVEEEGAGVGEVGGGVRGSYIHAEFTVQDELKFLIREGAAAQYGLTESRERADTEPRACSVRQEKRKKCNQGGGKKNYFGSYVSGGGLTWLVLGSVRDKI